MPILSIFVSAFQKWPLFWRTLIINDTKCVTKVTSSPLPVFFCHCTAKNKDIALTFVCVLCIYLDDIHSCFLDILKTLNFISNYLKKKFWVLRVKIEKWHNPEVAILQNVQCYAIWRFSIASYFKTEHYSNLLTFAVFWPKMAKRDVTKTPFSQKIITGFFLEILVADVQLMMGKVLKVSRRYLPPFLSYRENPAGGGRICPPPPATSGARVKY